MSFVLVPGAGGDGWYWHLVVPLLEAAGHQTIAVDLPAGDPDAGLDAYADVIVAAAGNANDITMVARPGETFGEWWGAVGQSAASRAYAERDGRDPDAPWDEVETFFHDVPA